MPTQDQTAEVAEQLKQITKVFAEPPSEVAQQISDAKREVEKNFAALEDLAEKVVKEAVVAERIESLKPLRDAYAEAGRLRWTLKSALGQLESLRFKFGPGNESRDISIAITELENVLFRLDRVVENGNC